MLKHAREENNDQANSWMLLVWNTCKQR